ncbi:hypothetical protein HYPSUDRAFT_1008823 [Hypholoma sublateritium FD-334 SS-4]|uniref:FAD/NAD(P)-binding domain-containing protein n=1 Tax=Hypholoma sublateritium (strain FD-334 SS-4) TaxID=945553 RepID=A0A0D2PBP8_HYPSF|nr:hypothetical protein HYPSUDRAFT_1008823 [Hypholoma sublateritium FD-334 SS-4]
MSTRSKQNVVIVGAGYAGLNAWLSLSNKLDVKKHNLVLINPRPYFTHFPAALRMATTAEGKLEDKILMPLIDSKYNTGNKKLIIASVTSIVEQGNEGGHLVLDNGEKVEYSILILATGMGWDGPLALPDTKAEAVGVVTSWREKFAQANDIVLVGGGSIGLELAGEIKDLSSTKNVTIVHSQSQLLNGTYPNSWRTYVGKQFASRGVKLVLGDYVDDLEIREGRIKTRSSKSIKADLVVPTRGGRPNTKFIESLGDVVSPSGTVRVTPTLHIVGHPRIFVAGDIIEWKEQKQAAKAPNHALVVVHNTLVLLGLSKKAAIPYKGSSELIIITNGKNGGAGFFDILWGISIGNWLSSLLKSKSLLVDMTQKSLQFA